MENNIAKISAFPMGESNTAFEQYFSGKSYLAPLISNDFNFPMVNVTFEPGCRNNWHAHTGGQILICVEGSGFYQERDQPARQIKAGDVLEIPAKVEHWHSAAPDSCFSHISITCNPQTNIDISLELVTEEDYEKAVK